MRRTAGLGVALLVFGAALFRSMLDGIGLVDEAWFLQVVARCRAGEVLYRDVFFGATPLSVYLTSALTRVTGVDVWAEKIVTNAAFAASVWIAWRLVQRLHGPRAAGLAAAGLVLLARPYTSPPYTPVAVACFMGTLAVLLRSQDARRRVGAVDDWLVGLLVGLTFLAKQNVGVLAALAAGAAVIAGGQPIPDRMRRIGGMAAGSVTTIAAGLVAVVAAGGFPAFLDYGFLNKGAYVRFAEVSYAASLGAWLSAVLHPGAPGAAAEVLHGLILFLPAAVLAAAVVVARSRGFDRTDRSVLLFAAAGTCIAFPRWNRYHLAYAVPVLVVALASLWRSRGEHAGSRGLSGMAGWALPATVVVLLVPGVAALAHGATLSRIPHFRGALLAPDEQARLTASAAAIGAASQGRPLLVIDPRAGFVYLAAGLRNPTPFDFPAVTSVGRHGTSSLLSELTDGELPQVCVGHDREGLFYFGAVVSAVTDRFTPGDDLGLCRLYRARTTGRQAIRAATDTP